MEIYNEDLENQNLSKMTVLMQLLTRNTAKNLNNIFTNNIEQSKNDFENIADTFSKMNAELVFYILKNDISENNSKNLSLEQLNSIITKKINEFKNNNKNNFSKNDFINLYSYGIYVYNQIKNNIFSNKISLNYLEKYYLNDKVFLDVISGNKVN